MSSPSWFAPLGDRFKLRCSTATLATIDSRLNTISDKLDAMSAGDSDTVRNRLIASLLGRAEGGVVDQDVNAYASQIKNAIAQARSALVGDINQVLAPLQDAANQLKAAAQLAWQTAETITSTVRTLESVEHAAAKIAMATGLPPVDAAWAGAAEAKHAAHELAEQAASAGRAADRAWSIVQRNLDKLRSEIFKSINYVADSLDDAIDAASSGVKAAASGDFDGAFDDFESIVDDVSSLGG